MIKAIETRYNGYRFRSRLEARWAVFFDALNIDYEYEKEGYDLDGTWYLPDFWLPHFKMWIEIKGIEPTKDEKHTMALLAEGTGRDGWILSGNMGEKRMSLTGFEWDDGYLEPLYKVWGVYGNIESYFSDFLLSFWTHEIVDFLKSKQSHYHLMEIPDEIKSIKDVQKVITEDKRYYKQKHGKEHFNRYTSNNLRYINSGGMGWCYYKGQIELAKIDFRRSKEQGDAISQAYRAARGARFEHGENG